MGKGKFLKGVAAVAAIGGICYVFRDKIKNSTVYQSLDVDEKVEKVKHTIKEKMPAKDESDRDYFSLSDAANDETGGAESGNEGSGDMEAAGEPVPDSASDESAEADDAGRISEEAATISMSATDITARVDSLISDIPMNQTAAPEETESPLLYENEGLSDGSEDFDVLEEQDKLDL